MKNEPFSTGFDGLLRLRVLILLALVFALTFPARAQSPFGSALDFTNSQFVVVSNFGNILPTSEVTVEFWANLRGAPQTAFILSPDQNTNRFNCHPLWSDNNCYWDFGNINAGGRTTTGNISATSNTWVHYAMVASQSGNFMRVYTNGILVAFKVGMTPFRRNPYHLMIGGNSGTANLNGRLDEFRVWSVARSQAQIQSTLALPLAGNEPGLLVYYRFDTTNDAVAVNHAPATGVAYNGKIFSPIGLTASVPTNAMFGMSLSRVVTTTADSGPGSLREAVAYTLPGGRVTFSGNLSGQTIVLTSGEILLNRDLTIDGSGLPRAVRLDGNQASRVFRVAGANVVLDTLTIMNGRDVTGAGGGIYNGGHLTVNRSALVNNTTSGRGGAIFNDTASRSLVLNQCTVAYNAATNGAGIYNSALSTLTAVHCTVANNRVPHLGEGGGLYNGQTANLTNSIFCGNTALVNANVANLGIMNGSSNLVDTFAFLKPLGYYGGPTPTMVPLFGSPAINAGNDATTNALATDQRGTGYPRFSRPHVDIGAAELSLPASSLTLNGPASVTNECHTVLVDAGATGQIAPWAIAAGADHSLLLKVDQTIPPWGLAIPAGLTNVAAIAAGADHALALRSDGKVVGWGWNCCGQADPPAGLSNVVAIAAGNLHSLAIQGDGTVAAWGDNDRGETSVPAGLNNVVAVAAGDSHSLALKSDGTIVAWGNSLFGQATVPSGLSNVVAIAAGQNHSLALKSDGTLVAWGSSSGGQADIPVGLGGVVAMTAGFVHSLALKSDGTLVAWGGNGYGQSTIPAGLSNVAAVAAGFAHNLALKTDGTLVAWGRGYSGLTTISGELTAPAISVGGTFNTNNPPGSYTRTYQISNPISDGPTVARSVVVQDTLAPVLTLNGSSLLIFTNANHVFTDPGATALDLCGGTLPVQVNNPVNPNLPGIYTITYLATDASGNSASQTRTVAVAVSPSVPGDTNGDGIVSQSELDAVYANYVANSPWLQMTNVAGLGGTQVSFALSNSLLGAYTVESSTNLLTWEPLGPASPRYLFIDTNAPASPQRHYRLRYP